MPAYDDRTSRAIDWLLDSGEPAVRYLTRRDLLDQEHSTDRKAVLRGPKVAALLAGQRSDGGFGVHPYSKWSGAHWRLVSLVELAIPAGHPGAVRAAGSVLDWLTSDAHRSRITTADGLTRRCASQEGNALAVASRLGMGDDPRARLLATSLVGWQWPDGGWNCDVKGKVASVHETHPPMWGLHEYGVATGDEAAADAARRAAEVFLSRRLFRSKHTGEVIRKEWLAIHYPPYWHYDVLQGLLVLSRLGLAADPRAVDALDHLERRRLDDGRWRPGAYWWSTPGGGGRQQDVVDWGRSGPNEMITLNALRVLRSAGRL
jgi:hypothetical protein